MTSDEIRAARKTVGMSQAEFAGAVGVSLRTVRRLEAGETSIRYKTSQRIEALLRERRGGTVGEASAR